MTSKSYLLSIAFLCGHPQPPQLSVEPLPVSADLLVKRAVPPTPASPSESPVLPRRGFRFFRRFQPVGERGRSGVKIGGDGRYYTAKELVQVIIDQNQIDAAAGGSAAPDGKDTRRWFSRAIQSTIS
jgi:hypothetical protein